MRCVVVGMEEVVGLCMKEESRSSLYTQTPTGSTHIYTHTHTHTVAKDVADLKGPIWSISTRYMNASAVFWGIGYWGSGEDG